MNTTHTSFVKLGSVEKLTLGDLQNLFTDHELGRTNKKPQW